MAASYFRNIGEPLRYVLVNNYLRGQIVAIHALL